MDETIYERLQQKFQVTTAILDGESKALHDDYKPKKPKEEKIDKEKRI